MIKKIVITVFDICKILYMGFSMTSIYKTFEEHGFLWGYFQMFCLLFPVAFFRRLYEGFKDWYQLKREAYYFELFEKMCIMAMVKIKTLEYKDIHEELFKYHHKRQFYRKIDEELLPVAWHPDRAVDWCFDEDEKKNLQILWGKL